MIPINLPMDALYSKNIPWMFWSLKIFETPHISPYIKDEHLGEANFCSYQSIRIPKLLEGRSNG